MDLKIHTESKMTIPSEKEDVTNMCEINAVSNATNNLFCKKFNITDESGSGFVKSPLFDSVKEIFPLKESVRTHEFSQYFEQFVSMQSHICINQELQKNNDFESWIFDNLFNVNELFFQNYNFTNLNATEIFSMKMPHVHNHALSYSTNQSPLLGINMLTLPCKNFHSINYELKCTEYIYNVASNNYTRSNFFSQENDLKLKGIWKSDYIKTSLQPDNCFIEPSVNNKTYKIGNNVKNENVENNIKCIVQDVISTQVLPEKLPTTELEHINVFSSDNMKLKEINSFEPNEIKIETDLMDINLEKDLENECKIIYEDLPIKIVYEKLSYDLKNNENVKEKKEIVNENVKLEKEGIVNENVKLEKEGIVNENAKLEKEGVVNENVNLEKEGVVNENVNLEKEGVVNENVKLEKEGIVNENVNLEKDFETESGENEMIVEEDPSLVKVGQKRNRSPTPENTRSVKIKLETNTERIEIDFVSEDPKENSDNFDPRWEKLRLLSKDPENFKLVRSRWGNLAPPNPFLDLTYRHNGSTGKVGKNEVRGRLKTRVPKNRSKGRSLSCVTYFERIINEMSNKCNNELRDLRKRLDVELMRIDFKQKMKRLELFGALMFPNDYVIQSTLNEQEKERQRARAVKQYCEVQKQIIEKRDSYIFFYKKYMTEVRAFCTSSDNIEHDDKLSDEQILHWDETERMYSEYTKFYG